MLSLVLQPQDNARRLSCCSLAHSSLALRCGTASQRRDASGQTSSFGKPGRVPYRRSLLAAAVDAAVRHQHLTHDLQRVTLLQILGTPRAGSQGLEQASLPLPKQPLKLRMGHVGLRVAAGMPHGLLAALASIAHLVEVPHLRTMEADLLLALDLLHAGIHAPGYPARQRTTPARVGTGMRSSRAPGCQCACCQPNALLGRTSSPLPSPCGMDTQTHMANLPDWSKSMLIEPGITHNINQHSKPYVWCIYQTEKSVKDGYVRNHSWHLPRPDVHFTSYLPEVTATVASGRLQRTVPPFQ